MKRLIVTAVALLSLSSGDVIWAQSTTRPSPTAPGQASFKVLADRVIEMFPAITTDVVEVAGSRITLAAGRRDGVQPGVELVGFREGREIYHPTTKKLLGRTEETLGRVVVAEVFENYSVATVVSGKAPEAGDKVRVSAGKVPLTLLAMSAGARPQIVEAATYELIQELERSGRFQIVLGDSVAVWLGQERIAPADFMRGTGVAAAAQRFKFANLLALHFTTVDGKPYMDVRFFSGASAAPLLTTAQFVPPSVKPRPAQEFSSGQAQGNVRVERRSLLARLLSGNFEPNSYSASSASIPLRSLATFPFVVTSMDVAVAPGDKLPRIVVTEGQRVFVYRLNNGVLEAEWTFDKRMVGTILNVQFADLNGDGVLEVVVNRQDYKVGMLSYILATEAGRPSMLVAEIPLILLAVDENGDGVNRTLFAQKYSELAYFTKGPVTRYVLKDNKEIVPSGTVQVDDTFRAAGAVFSNVGGKDTRVLAFVDDANRLKLVSGGQEVWRSLTVVGGGLAQARLQIPMHQTIVDKFIKVEPNPISIDLDGDGTQEIVVPINEDESGRMGVVFKGPVGYRMQVVSSGFEGMVTGLGAVPSDGSVSLVAAVVKRTGMWRTGGDTQIIMTIPE